jgi:hypothetical protein
MQFVFTQNVTLSAQIVIHFLIKPKVKFNFCEAMLFPYTYLDYLSNIYDQKKQPILQCVVYMRFWNEHVDDFVLVFYDKW